MLLHSFIIFSFIALLIFLSPFPLVSRWLFPHLPLFTQRSSSSLSTIATSLTPCSDTRGSCFIHLPSPASPLLMLTYSKWLTNFLHWVTLHSTHGLAPCSAVTLLRLPISSSSRASSHNVISPSFPLWPPPRAGHLLRPCFSFVAQGAAALKVAMCSPSAP